MYLFHRWMKLCPFRGKKMQKLKITLRNGCHVILKNCTPADFNLACDAMESWKLFFIWDEQIWIRKKEIISFEMVD